MDLPFAVPVLRERRKRIVDPYNPGKTIAGPWADPDTIPLKGFVASSSSSALKDATRNQVLTAKSLFLSDPTADVLVGDRIRVGTEKYEVEAIPAADINPFTGWQPAVEIPLTGATG
ncbi:MAG: hypothetical protein ACOH1M_09740 [Rhodoglobus sp.]